MDAVIEGWVGLMPVLACVGGAMSALAALVTTLAAEGLRLQNEKLWRERDAMRDQTAGLKRELERAEGLLAGATREAGSQSQIPPGAGGV